MHAKVGPILREHEVYAERRVLKFSHRYNIQINLIPLKVNINGAGLFLIDYNPVT